MPTTTTNFSLNKPLVNDAVDEDLWGGQLNTNMDSIDDRLTPTGAIIMFAGTTAPNADWLLCDGAAVSRTTFSALFALVSTSFGVGDGSTTFNVPDLRGRTPIGLDNLGSSSANRITDANADNLNSTGGGDEDDTSTISGSVSSHTLTSGEMPAHIHTLARAGGGSFGAGPATGASSSTGILNFQTIINQPLITTTSTGGGGGHVHSDTFAVSGTAKNTQPWLALGAIIKT